MTLDGVREHQDALEAWVVSTRVDHPPLSPEANICEGLAAKAEETVRRVWRHAPNLLHGTVSKIHKPQKISETKQKHSHEAEIQPLSRNTAMTQKSRSPHRNPSTRTGSIVPSRPQI